MKPLARYGSSEVIELIASGAYSTQPLNEGELYVLAVTARAWFRVDGDEVVERVSPAHLLSGDQWRVLEGTGQRLHIALDSTETAVTGETICSLSPFKQTAGLVVVAPPQGGC